MHNTIELPGSVYVQLSGSRHLSRDTVLGIVRGTMCVASVRNVATSAD